MWKVHRHGFERHCFDFYRENGVPGSIIDIAKQEIHLNRDLIEEFGEDEMHSDFNRALCEDKIDACYDVLNFRARQLITDWDTIRAIVDIHSYIGKE